MADFTVSIPAGPIWNDEDGTLKGPIVAASYNGSWNGQWKTIVDGEMSVVGVDFSW